MTTPELLRELDLSTYIAFDFETTGLSLENDRIIEIAAIKFEAGEAVDRFVTLVNPDRQIDPFITDITGISNAMVSNAPKEENIIDDILDFLEGHPLVAHNISFDISFLNSICERYNKPVVEHQLYDTLQLSRTYMFFHPTHSLSSISEYFNLSAIGAHRAEADTENTGIIFQHLIHEAASYPLEVTSKILSVSKNVDMHNKTLFINLSNALKKTGDLKNGLVSSLIDKQLYSNIFTTSGEDNLLSMTVSDVFAEGGKLSTVMDTYEQRNSQQEYSEFVRDKLFDDQNYCAIEAGTGLGKSMAYLFPALQKAFEGGNSPPLVISCHTKHLQDQLFRKDLPLLAEALNVPLHAMILKGRSNYICLTRFNWLIRDAGQQLKKDEIESLFSIIVWLHETQTGDLSECAGFWGYRPFKVAELIQSEPGYCTTSICNTNDGCYFGSIRHAIQDSQVIIVNHALLMSNFSNPGILPEFESIIVDEAHNLVDVAYDQMTIGLNRFKIDAILDIVDPNAPSAARWTQKLETSFDDNLELNSYFNELENGCKITREYGKAFFQDLSNTIAHHFNEEIQYVQYVIINNLKEGYGSVFSQIQELELSLSGIKRAIEGILKQLNTIDPEREKFSEIIQLFEHSSEAMDSLQTEIALLTHEQQNGWVYWQQGQFKHGRGKEKDLQLTINAAPIDIAEDMSKTFFKSFQHCILTSATLRVEESFEYFLNRTGLSLIENELVHTNEFHSPFFYEDQVRYYQYAGKNGQNPSLIADTVYSLHHEQQKRIMVLFTSRQALNQAYHELQKKPNGRKLPIFAQIGGASRYAMLRGMHRTPNGILFGTNAFWEGVDLPRELLEILIITKLPFRVPTEPKVQAYSNMLQNLGRNSFMEFTVPEAVVRFRQGFGRLIRTIEDEGLFIVMDERVVDKRYGSAFSDTIPVRMKTFHHAEELIT